MISYEEKMKQLQEMADNGILSDQEFEELKKRIEKQKTENSSSDSQNNVQKSSANNSRTKPNSSNNGNKKLIFIIVFVLVALLIVYGAISSQDTYSSDDSYYSTYDDDDYDDDYDDYDDFEAPKDELIVDQDGKKMYKVYCTDGSITFDGSFDGTGNFIVKVLDDNQDLEELVCNEIGSYVLDKTVYVGEGYHYLEIICSSGTWNMLWYGTGGE